MATYTMSQALQKNIKIPPIAYEYNGAEELVIKRDLTYCVRNNQAQCFDLYYPQNFIPFESKAVLFVNGGGPMDKNYKSYPCYTSWGELCAVNHIVGITFNWRTSKPEDIMAMLEYLKINADTLGSKLEELTVLSLCRAVNYTINCVLKYPIIKKVAMYYGKISTNTDVEKCKGMKFFIALGSKDKRFPPECNHWFLEKSKEHHYQVEIMIHPNGVHGFDYANNDQDTKEIIERTISFIKQSSTCK